MEDSKMKKDKIVIFVDDEEDFEKLLIAVFQGHSTEKEYNFHFLKSGDLALKFIETVQMDTTSVILIISDINMPGITGLELLKKVKEQYPQITIDIMTAYDEPGKRQRALILGAEEYYTKPLDLEIIKKRIDTLISNL